MTASEVVGGLSVFLACPIAGNEALDRAWEQPGPSLIVVWGRRSREATWTSAADRSKRRVTSLAKATQLDPISFGRCKNPPPADMEKMRAGPSGAWQDGMRGEDFCAGP